MLDSLPACFYRAAFFCHFWLQDKLCLNKQEGDFFGSILSPLLFPLVSWLVLPSLFIPPGAQTLAELLRLQRGCNSHKQAITFHVTERKKKQMLGAGRCPGDSVIGTDAESESQTSAGIIWPTTQVALDASSSGELCQPLTKAARGEARQQTAVTFSLGKLPG